jgi:hypothetical protein
MAGKDRQDSGRDGLSARRRRRVVPTAGHGARLFSLSPVAVVKEIHSQFHLKEKISPYLGRSTLKDYLSSMPRAPDKEQPCKATQKSSNT